MDRKSHVEHAERLPWIQGDPRKAFVFEGDARRLRLRAEAFPIGAGGGAAYPETRAYWIRPGWPRKG